MEMYLQHHIISYWILLSLLSLNVAATNLFSDKNYCILSDGSRSFKFYREQNKIKTSTGHIYFSICDEIHNDGCKHSSVCIEKNGIFVNGGKKFIIGANGKEKQSSFIESIGGSKCSSNPKQNITLTVIMTCSDTSAVRPVLLESSDDCVYKVEMMTFDCDPRCTKRIDGYHLIDLRPLNRSVHIEYGNSTFELSICSENSKCGHDVTACEINSGGRMALSHSSGESIHYDIDKNALSIKGRSGKKGQDLRQFELHFECSWETDFKDLAYISKVTQGRKYDFHVQSKFGCIKLKPECILDNALFHIRYNLTGLNKNGHWNVTRTDRIIFLNICGDLNIASEPNPCIDYQSQVCEIKTNNQYISRGSSTAFQFKDEHVEAIISDGSVCQEGKNYNTIINFHCYHKETGPVYVKMSEDNCTLYLEWKTPYACPYYHSSGYDNCNINDESGSRNLHGISMDKTKKISGKTLKYNICGSIKTQCGPFYGNVSACLYDNNSSLVIGWTDKKIISENQTLILNLEGEKCSNEDVKSKMTVQFICDRTNDRFDDIDVVYDGCMYSMKIHSPLACVPQAVYETECQTCIQNTCYNLNPLRKNSSNYLVKSHDQMSLDFFINICGSVINEYDLRCHHSMVCAKNHSEFNINQRYHSLGTMQKLSISNNSVVIHTTSGSACGNNKYYSSALILQCTEKEESPQLFKHDACHYEFIWKTKYACPTCSFMQASGESISLSKLENKKIRITVAEDNYYLFNMCDNICSRFLSGQKHDYALSKKIKGNTLIYSLENNCSLNTPLNTVLIHLICEPLDNNDHFEHLSTKDCIAEINLRTKIMCSSEATTNMETSVSDKEHKSDLNVKIQTTPEKTAEINKTAYKVIPPAIPIYLFCSIHSPNSEHIFEMFTSNLSNIIIEGQSYNVTWSHTQSSSHVCRNITFSDNLSLVNAYFSTDLVCGSKRYGIKVDLKCNNSNTLQLDKVEGCMISMSYLFSDVCTLMEKQAVSTSSSSLIGVIVGIIIILGLGVGYFIYRKKRKNKQHGYDTPLYYKDASE